MGPVCVKRVQFGELRIRSLPFTGEIVLLASQGHNLPISLSWFVAKCEMFEIKISTSKSETMVSQKRVEGPLQVSDNILPLE